MIVQLTLASEIRAEVICDVFKGQSTTWPLSPAAVIMEACVK